MSKLTAQIFFGGKVCARFLPGSHVPSIDLTARLAPAPRASDRPAIGHAHIYAYICIYIYIYAYIYIYIYIYMRQLAAGPWAGAPDMTTMAWVRPAGVPLAQIGKGSVRFHSLIRYVCAQEIPQFPFPTISFTH